MKIYSAKKTIFDEPVGRGEYFLRGWINLIFDNAESNKWFIVNMFVTNQVTSSNNNIQYIITEKTSHHNSSTKERKHNDT